MESGREGARGKEILKKKKNYTYSPSLNSIDLQRYREYYSSASQ